MRTDLAVAGLSTVGRKREGPGFTSEVAQCQSTEVTSPGWNLNYSGKHVSALIDLIQTPDREASTTR